MSSLFDSTPLSIVNLQECVQSPQLNDVIDTILNRIFYFKAKEISLLNEVLHDDRPDLETRLSAAAAINEEEDNNNLDQEDSKQDDTKKDENASTVELRRLSHNELIELSRELFVAYSILRVQFSRLSHVEKIHLSLEQSFLNLVRRLQEEKAKSMQLEQELTYLQNTEHNRYEEHLPSTSVNRTVSTKSIKSSPKKKKKRKTIHSMTPRVKSKSVHHRIPAIDTGIASVQMLPLPKAKAKSKHSPRRVTVVSPDIDKRSRSKKRKSIKQRKSMKRPKSAKVATSKNRRRTTTHKVRILHLRGNSDRNISTDADKHEIYEESEDDGVENMPRQSTNFAFSFSDAALKERNDTMVFMDNLNLHDLEDEEQLDGHSEYEYEMTPDIIEDEMDSNDQGFDSEYDGDGSPYITKKNTLKERTEDLEEMKRTLQSKKDHQNHLDDALNAKFDKLQGLMNEADD